MNEYLALLNGGCKFLDKKVDMTQHKVAFATYPRTGNSLLRKIIESVSGVFTGCDMQLDIAMGFQQSGLLGEEIIDDSCWINKTHYPLLHHEDSAFKASKIIYLTRHPIDVIPSFVHLILTSCHCIEFKRPINEFKDWS